jgi:hypothetical protein
MSKLNQLSIFPDDKDYLKIWESFWNNNAFPVDASISDLVWEGAKWVNEQIRPEIEALRAYSIEIHNDPTALTLQKLVDSHRTLRNLRLDTKEGYNAEMKAGYEHGKQYAMMHVAQNTIQLSDLKKMTMQEIANFIGEDQ